MKFPEIAPDRPLGERQVRVLLLLSSLHGGGAERVAVHLLNRLDPARFHVHMGLLRAAGPYLGEVDPAQLLVAPDGEHLFDFDGSNRAQFRLTKLLRGALAAPRAFRAMIEQTRPDVVLSFLKGTNLITWRALAGIAMPRPRWIAREGNNVLAVIREEAPFALAAHGIARLTAHAYRTADRVLVNASALAEDISADLGLAPDRVAMIHNPLDIAVIRERASAVPEALPQRPFLLAAGRLEAQKGHDVLLRAFAESGAARTHDLVVLGEGSKRTELEVLAAQLGLVGQVRLPGFVANPFAWMARCALFVLPSRWEGMSNALAEAMAAGAPVLAADCDYGPGEIVSHGVSGWLVPPGDVGALAEGLRTLLGDAGLRRRLAERGSVAVERFALDTIMTRYAGLIVKVANPSSSVPAPRPLASSTRS